MENTTSKKSRKAIHNYTFDSNSGPVEIDLNNYVAVCSRTNEPKSFYHAYLANLIQTKYDNNISTFEATYISRAGLSETVAARKAQALEDQITRLYDKLASLKQKRDQLASK